MADRRGAEHRCPCGSKTLSSLECPLLAQSGHSLLRCTCPLLGRTCSFALHMSASDPKRTLADLRVRRFQCASLSRHDALVLSLGATMRRREFITLLGGTVATWPLTARAQQSDRMRRLGILMAVAESDADVRKGIVIFQQRLQELGWKDGKNIHIDYRWGDADPDRIQALAKELVDLHPDALVGHSTPSAKGLLKQTHSIPIVFLTVTDPLGQGLVSSLSHPGGNITGFSVFEFSLGTKWVETLKQ